MNKNILSISSTEDDLIEDKNGEAKRSLIKQFEGEISRLKSFEKKGLSPEEFEKTNSLINSMQESIKVIEMTWAKYHLGNKQIH